MDSKNYYSIICLDSFDILTDMPKRPGRYAYLQYLTEDKILIPLAWALVSEDANCAYLPFFLNDKQFVISHYEAQSYYAN